MNTAGMNPAGMNPAGMSKTGLGTADHRADGGAASNVVGIEVSPAGCQVAHFAEESTEPSLLGPSLPNLSAALHALAPPRPVVLAVSASLSERDRREALATCAAAGFEVLRLVSAPLVGALAADLAATTHGVAAVFDLGEDAFDFRVVSITAEGQLEVRAAAVERGLGGHAMDTALARQVLAELALAPSPEHLAAAVAAAHAARAALDRHFSVPFVLELPDGRRQSRRLDRHRFGHCVRPQLERLSVLVHRAMEDAALRADEVDEVLLLGPGAHAPWVRAFVGELFMRRPRAAPFGAPALGAALLARRLMQGEPPMLLDAVSATLGLEADDGYIEWLLPRGAPFPASATRRRDGGPVVLKVYQGERQRSDDCRLVGTYQVDATGGIAVRFEVDADGLVHVQARSDLDGSPRPVQATLT
jgi:molecular chaperone DnaK (HSP70)